MLVGSVSDSKLCPFAATFTPRAREGCTSKLRQEVSKLTGIPFSTGYFQRLEHLVAATRLMGRNVVVVVETENSCPMTGFHMPIRLTTGTVHELRRCIRRTHDARLYWRTPTATVEVVTIMKSEMEGAEQGERTSVIYVDRAHKTPSHYEEFQGKLNSTEMSIIMSRRGYLTGQYKAGQSMEERELIQEYGLQPVMADEGQESGDKGVDDAFFSGESEGEESTQSMEQPTTSEEQEEPQNTDPQIVETEVGSCKQTWNDMCQKLVATNTKPVKKVVKDWSHMDGASKLVQIVTSHHTRKEASEEVPESDLVMVVGEKFWRRHTADKLKTIHATDLRPTATQKLSGMVIRESQDESNMAQQSNQFREKATMNKQTAEGKRARTYMPVITEETAKAGGYSAILTSVEMMLLLMMREVNVNDTETENDIRRMAAATGEVEVEYRGCYIAVKNEPNRELVRWRARVIKGIRGAPTEEEMVEEMERLEACAGTTAEWLRAKTNKRKPQEEQAENEAVQSNSTREADVFCAPTKEDVVEAAEEATVDATAAKDMPDATVEGDTSEPEETETEVAASTPNATAATQEDEAENTNQEKAERSETMRTYSSPAQAKRVELRAKADSVRSKSKTWTAKKHRITPDVIRGGADTRSAGVTEQGGVRNLIQEQTDQAVGRSGDLEDFGEHWQVEGAQDESEGTQYCRKDDSGQIVLIETESGESGSQEEQDEAGEESDEEAEEDRAETDILIQGENAADASECHQLRQRVERLKMEVAELKTEARTAEADNGKQAKVAKGYKAKNTKLIKELSCSKEKQLHLETQMQEMEKEQAHNYHLETQVQKMEEEREQLIGKVEHADERTDRALEEQRRKLEKEMQNYVDAEAAGLADFEQLVEDMESLEAETESRIEDMEKNLRQAQAETRALQKEQESKAELAANNGSEMETQNTSITVAEERIKELTDELTAQTMQREGAECALLEERGAMRVEAEATDSEIRELLERAEELDREMQGRKEELREKQRMHDKVVVENQNLGAEKESLSKELQTLREESSDKLKKENEKLLERMDKLKESNENEAELMSKQRTDMKGEIKELQETVRKTEVAMEEQKMVYLKEREVQEQDLIEAEAEISAMALSVKFEQDFKKLLGVLKQVAVGKSEQPSQEKPESQILNALEWYNTEVIEALCVQNNRLQHDKRRLTRQCVRQDVTLPEGNSWDLTFKMMIGDKEMERMSAEGVDRIKHHDEELKQARAELHSRTQGE